MVVFNHAQPALLYICPYLLIGSVAVAIARGGPQVPNAKLSEEAMGVPKCRNVCGELNDLLHL